MTTTKHKVFISYHHDNDQEYKEKLSTFGESQDIFTDESVDTGDISDDSNDQNIRKKIRDKYIKDASVLILLVGSETKNRKHIDWEIYSSMYDGSKNKKMGILVIQLPTIEPSYVLAAHGENNNRKIYPSTYSWETIITRKDYEEKYPYLPCRIIDNIIKSRVKISITTWSAISKNGILDKEKLSLLIDLTYQGKESCEYDLSTPMRKNNS